MRCHMPRYNNSRKTWRYTEEFKAKAVQLSLLDNIQVKEVAETLDIYPFMLSRWRKEYREGKIVADQRKIKELEKKIRRIEEEKEILKKATALLMSDSMNNLR